MKKIFTLLSVLPASLAFGQAITINSTDMPVPTSSYHIRNFGSTSAANPTVGTSATWDYSTYAGTADSINYVTETDTFFTNRGVDVYRLGFKTLIPGAGLGYDLYSEYDFNTTNVKEAGFDILDQPYDISSTTGGTADSLVVPAQRMMFTTAKEVVHFPFTANSSWTSSSRRSVNFVLTVAAASINHAPCTHVYYVNRKDTIVGWGKMKVYTASGASIQYDVLMDKVSEYAQDSFYISGAPASSMVLSAFGMAQNQKTDSNYRYNFYRKGTFSYLLSFSYGNDATYTSSTAGKFMHSDNITPAGVNDLDNAAYATVLFPNPANGNEINLMIQGRDVREGKYTITDMSGKTIQFGAVEMKNGLVNIATAQLANGNYVLSVQDAGNNTIANEQFSVAK